MSSYLKSLKSNLDAYILNGDLNSLSSRLSRLDSEKTNLSQRQIMFLRDQYAPGWWKPLSSMGISLRRRSGRDADFVQNCFCDESFAKNFMRDFSPVNLNSIEHLRTDLDHEYLTPPFVQKNAVWVACRGDQSLGLIALANIERNHLTAELLVGFPCAGSLSSVKATVTLIDHVFKTLKLEKLISYVFLDNHHSQSSTQSLGFVCEGLLRSEFLSKEGVRLDLYRNGLLQEDFYNIKLVKKLLQHA